ncbi:TolC family protein [Bythopirellula goksoeyrii]|uniref:Cobalt-zinc-cadmium resistance protein CzcC n=1 Tax=Bythopirellula goksoeyrii TaxID=1400387 RepID=A0A5B9QFU4_9BACT|nr:TolC family protein [Bythopirellula goksoeyrii]QEG35786.1 Cobalt-zinc-cadmium resistance protein CzcC precursor [Bythopirellula goksoeyrii]
MTDHQIRSHKSTGNTPLSWGSCVLAYPTAGVSHVTHKLFVRLVVTVLTLALLSAASCVSQREIGLPESNGPEVERFDVRTLSAVSGEGRTVLSETFLPKQVIQIKETNSTVSAEGDSDHVLEQSKSSANVVFAHTTQSDAPLVLHEIIAAAIDSHPSIIAARQRVAAAANRIPQARALPDPVLANSLWPVREQSPQTASGRISSQLSLKQGVPWPGKLYTQEAIASHELVMAEAELANSVQEIKEAVQLAYYELWLYEEATSIVEANQALARNLIKVSEARYRAGGSQQDVVRAELETEKLEDQLISLRRSKEEAKADLGTLVRNPLDFQFTKLEEPNTQRIPLALDELVESSHRCNPNLMSLVAEKSRDRDRRKLARLKNYPDFEFGLMWAQISDDHDALSPVANGRDSLGINVAITLPIWREKIDSGREEAKHTFKSTAARYEAGWDELRGMLRRLVAAADALAEQIALYEQTLIPRTEQNLELATADYRAERGDFFGVVDVYEELLTHRLQLARAKASLAGTIAQIERTVGC